MKAVQAILGVDPGGTARDLGSLSLPQCQNIAYEIVWSQQPPVPAPPDPIENLYTNPPNNGVLISGSGSNISTNQNEGDRRQFEATLQGYYATANATADRLTNYVYALAAAVACEELSLAAAQALIEFPVNPAAPEMLPSTKPKSF